MCFTGQAVAAAALDWFMRQVSILGLSSRYVEYVGRISDYSDDKTVGEMKNK